jgi:biopolymer transport protein ExbD
MSCNQDSRKRDLAPGRDLRTRYVPSTRIRPIFSQLTPWLDLLFILFFLVLAQSRLVLQPGVVVALPAHGGMGVLGGARAVLMPVVRGGRVSPTVYFADEAFRLDDAARAKALEDMLERVRRKDGVISLTLYTDLTVSHDYVMQVMQMAARSGFEFLNMGTAAAPAQAEAQP